MALLWRLYARSSSTRLTTVLSGTTGEGAAVKSVHMFGVGSGSHSVGSTTGEGSVLASGRLDGVG
jgi:hypothetical protein